MVEREKKKKGDYKVTVVQVQNKRRKQRGAGGRKAVRGNGE